MNIVSGALVQNINNAGGQGRRGATTRAAKQISGAHNGLIPMAVLSIMFVGGTASGATAPCCCATAVNFERSAAASGKFRCLATAQLTLSFGGGSEPPDNQQTWRHPTDLLTNPLCNFIILFIYCYYYYYFLFHRIVDRRVKSSASSLGSSCVIETFLMGEEKKNISILILQKK